LKAILPPEDQPHAIPDEPEDVRVVTGKLSQGSNFSLLLQKHGMGKSGIHNLIQSVKKIHDISRLPAGTPYELRFREDVFLGLRCEINGEHAVVIKKDADKYVVEREPIDYEIETITREAMIKDNLYNTILRMGEKPLLVHELTEIFAWDINFFKDLREGDRLRLVVEKSFRNGKFIKYGSILGAEFVNQGKTITAIYFPEKDDYFTPEGKSLRKQFLKAPLKYSSVSSGFTHKRFHPILKKNVPHLSVDYSAPVGTPIHAVADGTVTFAGQNAPSGKHVWIKHNGVYASAYCHLSVFGAGIKKGTMVKQGQIIGRVGMTGRTTGPHLCYHFRKDGAPIDPLKFQSPKAIPVPKKEWDAFAQVKKEILEKLGASPASPGDAAKTPQKDI